MRRLLAGRALSLLSACCAVSACGWLLAAEPTKAAPMIAAPTDAAPSIQEVADADGQIIAIEARSLPADGLMRLNQRPDSQAALARVLNVTVDDPAASQTAMAGSYTVRPGVLRFTPRYAFRAGQGYRVVLHWSELGPGAASDVIDRFRAPAQAGAPPAEVTAIFPSAASLPENQLRFYLHFSAPMARGAAYDHVRLLDRRGRPVDLPFLELGEELWDPRQQRLTLLIDPGRIKRGVQPRESVGPVLRSGEQYTLVVQASWLDAQNRPLRQALAKHFRVGPPIASAIDPAQWQLRVPAGGSRDPLAIDFLWPLDHALLQRMLAVRSAAGTPIEGEVRVSHEERRWELRPALPWPLGKFEVVVDRALEDLAGNRIGRPFEVDQVGPITQQIQTGVVRLEFEIRAPR
ncbi:MAG TPA: hypothetical protein VIK18_22350 [Pirellulales bacterium]